MVLKPWDQRKETAFEMLPKVQAGLGSIPGIEMFPVMPPALPGGGQFPVEIVLLSTEEPERMLEFAKMLQGKAMASKSFFFPPIIDTKIDQPQAEIVIDHDKVATLGLNLQQIGADISAAVGGNFVNRFNISGRSYKVIPQIKRSERLNPEQLKDIYVTGPDDKLIPLSTVATIREKTVPRSLNRFQQLNAVTISGMSSLPIDQALRDRSSNAPPSTPQAADGRAGQQPGIRGRGSRRSRHKRLRRRGREAPRTRDASPRPRTR
jgi:multidrug efflux pump